MDDFSDDGFDDLNVALLQELENSALRALQSQQPFQQNARSSITGGGSVEVIKVDDDVDQADAEVLRELARVPAQHSLAGRLAAAAAPPPLPLPAYSQQSFVDVPLPAVNNNAKNNAYFSGATQRRVQGPPSVGSTAATTGPGGSVAPSGPAAGRTPALSAANSTVFSNAAANKPTPSDNAAIAALQARVRTLETDLYTARGRASMIHERFETAQRKHEAEIARIQRQKDEELAKQRQRAEAAVAAHKSAATELEFAKQDLKEEVERGKKGRRADRQDGPTTPRKNTAGRSNWNVADGFEDIELLPSPSKGLGRRFKDAGGGAVTPAVERTPTKAKRRRPITDSPTMPLETVAVDADADVFNASPSIPTKTGAAATAAPEESTQSTEEPPFVFLQEVLGHQSHPDQPTTIELFSRYTFPSNRKQTLAFLMLQRIPKLEGTQGTTRLMLDFCQLILGIWSQCKRENYYAPVRALVSLLSYILMREPHGLAPHILDSLLPIAQDTICLVAGPAFNSFGGSLSNHPDYAVRQLACDIDAGAIMSLLRLVAFGCLSQTQADGPSQQQPSQGSYPGLSTSAQTRFWSLMQFEFVLLMLSSKQPPDAFLGMLSLLRTSALPDSIGPITNDPSRDTSVVASLIIDRISHHIEVPPKWAGLSKYTEWDVRLSALGVFDCFAQSPFGKLSLAASDCALPRLVDVFFPAYGELRDRDLLEEPFERGADQFALPESQIRAYGIGGFDLSETLCPGAEKPTRSMAATVGDAVTQTVERDISSSAPSHDKDRSFIPLVLLYISSVVYLLHSIITDPFTSTVANIPAKLAEIRGGTQSFYLLTLARLGFRADPAFAVGLNEETYRLALELFQLAATPEELEDYSQWAQESRSWAKAPIRGEDPFSDYALGELDGQNDTSIVKTEDMVT